MRGPAPVHADGRFAPSPTGTLHLGNLRTALLAWLFARAAGARFLVRLEDLDTGRVRPGIAEGQLADLAGLGLCWDGPVVRQSERHALYAEALVALERAGLIYPCWCTRSEIRAAASAPHGPLPDGAYPGTCRDLPAAELALRQRSGRPTALRVRADGVREAFVDRLCGPVEGVVDDFVVRRSDRAYAYNLAVVVDDAQQEVGEIVRGADLLESTPRQRWLQRTLGLPEPGYAHVPLLLSDDGHRIAKRDATEARGDLAAPQLRGILASGVGLAEPGEAPSLDTLITRMRTLLATEVTA
ncbi:MAG: tRNA glutamyl-Q(34) synthetase GluQRS [Actinobacteria bacterium]|nr:tRNA glutamyl-Q(34) synthetase GluQRS [Actinomycetota bacterium]